VEEPYRRDIKGIRNLQESRHALAGKIFHGRKGEVYQRYYKGMEDQLGALGLVLNCVTLWNTFYVDKALARLRAAGHSLAEEDVARLSPFVRRHINVIGTLHLCAARPRSCGGPGTARPGRTRLGRVTLAVMAAWSLSAEVGLRAVHEQMLRCFA
jgi:hypothetical protein